MRHAVADGWLRRQPLTAAQALPPPETPLPVIDPVVFGPFGPTPHPAAGTGLVWHRCAVHETAWRGDGGCWACEGET